jgi:hypothetical protein
VSIIGSEAATAGSESTQIAGGIVRHLAPLTLMPDRGYARGNMRQNIWTMAIGAWMATQSPSDRKSNLLVEMTLKSGHPVAPNVTLRVPSLRGVRADVSKAMGSVVPRVHDYPILE